MRGFKFLVASLVAAGALGAQQDRLSTREQEAITKLRAQTIREVTVALTDSAMEGRGTGQMGGDRAARYLADRFSALQLKGGGDGGTFLQRVPVDVVTLLPSTVFRVGRHTFSFKEDFALGQPESPHALDAVMAPVVFVGYGVVSPALKRDELAGIDVAGKIVMVLSGTPAGVNASVWDKESAQRVVFGRLIANHAVGFIVVDDGDPARFPLVATAISNRTVRPAERTRTGGAARWSLELLADQYAVPPSVLVSQATADTILEGRLAQVRQQLDSGRAGSRDLGVEASIEPRVVRASGVASNVIGVLPGSDAQLAHEAFVYTAHYDAFGRDTTGIIFPGAADNALAVGKLVALAESFATTSRRRRSIIFMATTGEEYGNIGARTWLAHPTWPLDRVAADINFDAIAPLDVWGRLAFVFNFGFDESELGDIARSTATALGITIAPDPGEGFGTRSDHYEFIQHGIPALFLVGGPPLGPRRLQRASDWASSRYHYPTDVVQSDWDWDGARSLAAFALVVGLRIDQQDALPGWKTGVHERPVPR